MAVWKTGRLIWWIFLVFVAISATIVQFDRQSRRSPDLVRYVPSWFNGNAQAMRAITALEEGHQREAVIAAARLVAVRPVPAENITLVALAAANAGGATLANQAISEAARRGWRDPTAQTSMLAAALAQGDATTAAQRLDALLRIAQPSSATDDGFAALAATDVGRKALVQRLNKGPPWIAVLLQRGPTIMSAGAFSSLLQEARHEGIAFDCAELAKSTVALLRLGQLAASKSVWNNFCAHSAVDLEAIWRPAAEEANIVEPFGWIYPAEPGIVRNISWVGSSPALSWRNNDVVWRALAARYVTLAPGRHRVRMGDKSTNEADLVETGKVRIAAICFASTTTRPATWHLAVDNAGGISVPVNCPVQYVSVLVEQGDGQVQNFGID